MHLAYPCRKSRGHDPRGRGTGAAVSNLVSGAWWYCLLDNWITGSGTGRPAGSAVVLLTRVCINLMTLMFDLLLLLSISSV